MMKKYPVYALFFISVAFITSCTSGCVSVNSSLAAPERLPRQAFVQVQQAVELEGCGIDPETKEEKCQQVTMRSVSSGSYVFISEVADDVAYVLTAGHSCTSRTPKEQMVDGFRIRNCGNEIRRDGQRRENTCKYR